MIDHFKMTEVLDTGPSGAQNFPGWPGKDLQPGSPEIFFISRNYFMGIFMNFN